MTDDEAVEAFNKEQHEHGGDAEGAHGKGDNFVSNILRNHGFPKLADAYDKECKDWWYA